MAVAVQDQQWFYSTGGERFGPVGFDHLLELSRKGQLDPRNDLVWTTTLSDWEPAGEIEGLFERRMSPPVPEASLGGTELLTRTGEYVSPVIVPQAHQGGGVGRLGYLFGSLVLPAALGAGWGFVSPFLAPYLPEAFRGYLPWGAVLLALLAAVVLVVNRFKNLGMGGGWLAGTFVPILNLWLGYRLVACPPGYAVVKRLDGIGKVLAFLYWGGILAVLGLLGAAAAGFLGEMKDSGMLEDLMKHLKELRASALPER